MCVDYLQPGEILEVVAEQFDYLVDHMRQLRRDPEACTLDCPDCQRFERVHRILMKPFRARNVTPIRREAFDRP